MKNTGKEAWTQIYAKQRNESYLRTEPRAFQLCQVLWSVCSAWNFCGTTIYTYIYIYLYTHTSLYIHTVYIYIYIHIHICGLAIWLEYTTHCGIPSRNPTSKGPSPCDFRKTSLGWSKDLRGNAWIIHRWTIRSSNENAIVGDRLNSQTHPNPLWIVVTCLRFAPFLDHGQATSNYDMSHEWMTYSHISMDCFDIVQETSKQIMAGWWFGTWILWLSIQLGISSSQLTNSYFSEG